MFVKNIRAVKIDLAYLSLKIGVGLCSAVLLFMFAYIWFIYSTIPILTYWRTIWIETAMTTGSHGWLATAFIPAEIIDGVMNNSAGNPDVIGGLEHLHGSKDKDDEKEEQGEHTGEDGSADEKPPDDGKKPERPGDILGQASLSVGGADYAGNTILVNDIEEGIVISEITGSGYKGKIMMVDDPSRVFLGNTTAPGIRGMRIKEMLTEYGAVAGINASGFMDHAGEGTGGEVVGLSCSSGKYWGDYVNYYGSVVLTDEDRLVVGNIAAWKNYNIRDGIQFGPVLIANGEIQIKGSAGYGLQPRTAIGQREDGVILMLIIDGRDLTHSIGCTVGDVAEILLKYNALNAACCDGGASTVMAYDGEVINRNCSANPTLGRMMPNAFLVRSKSA